MMVDSQTKQSALVLLTGILFGLIIQMVTGG